MLAFHRGCVVILRGLPYPRACSSSSTHKPHRVRLFMRHTLPRIRSPHRAQHLREIRSFTVHHLIKSPSNGSPCSSLNHLSISPASLNPSARASKSHSPNPPMTVSNRSPSKKQDTNMPSEVERGINSSLWISRQTASRNICCLLRYGLACHVRSESKSPGLVLRPSLRVGRIVCRLVPDLTSSAKRGLKR